MGFENLGYLFVLILAVLARPIIGLACLVPAWIRVSKDGDPESRNSIYWLLAGVLAAPLYLLLGSFFNVEANSGSIILLPVPVISIVCTMVGMMQSFQGSTRAAKVASVVLMIYIVLETALVALFVLPHLV